MRLLTSRSLRFVVISFPLAALWCGCGVQSGPDKTVAGAVLGAGWGAGTGAIIGNQLDTGPGAAAGVGAGFGALAGAMSGAQQDFQESDVLKLEDELFSLKVQNMAARNELEDVQARLDRLAVESAASSVVHQVYFGEDETDLRAGSSATLEVLVDNLKRNPRAVKVVVAGHTDDSGNPEHNQRLAEARARSVVNYITARGISADQVELKSFGSTRPVASNTTPEGRQLNRRVEIYIAH